MCIIGEMWWDKASRKLATEGKLFLTDWKINGQIRLIESFNAHAPLCVR